MVSVVAVSEDVFSSKDGIVSIASARTSVSGVSGSVSPDGSVSTIGMDVCVGSEWDVESFDSLAAAVDEGIALVGTSGGALGGGLGLGETTDAPTIFVSSGICLVCESCCSSKTSLLLLLNGGLDEMGGTGGGGLSGAFVVLGGILNGIDRAVAAVTPALNEREWRSGGGAVELPSALMLFEERDLNGGLELPLVSSCFGVAASCGCDEVFGMKVGDAFITLGAHVSVRRDLTSCT